MFKLKKSDESGDLPDLPVEEPVQEQKRSMFGRKQVTQPVIVTPKKERIQVVKELPVQQIREYEDKDGTIIHFMTIEEALTEFMNQ